jgi:TonB family protein
VRPLHALGVAPLAILCLGAAGASPPLDWVEAPTYAQAAALYPADAKAHPVSGQATLSCTVAYSGRLSDCVALAVSPDGQGFDEAARKLARQLRLRQGPGTSSGDEVRFQVKFPAEMATGAPTVEDRPAWAAIPPISDFQATFPKTENGVNHVRVVLACDVKAGGALSDCDVASEDPAGQGYGQAALALGPKFRVGLMTTDGAPTVGTRVHVPIRYELTPEKPPAS